MCIKNLKHISTTKGFDKVLNYTKINCSYYQFSAMNQGQTVHQHPRIKCDICGMEISQKHLGRHKSRRHSFYPNNSDVSKINQAQQTHTNQPVTLKSRTAEVQQAIEDQSNQTFSDDIRFVKVRISESELIKLMNRGRIYHAVGKFFMYDS